MLAAVNFRGPATGHQHGLKLPENLAVISAAVVYSAAAGLRLCQSVSS